MSWEEQVKEMKSKDPLRRIFNSNNGDWEWMTEFAGIPMCLNYWVYHRMSTIFSSHKFDIIIDLGTFKGATAAYLGIEGLRNDIPVHTFEITKQTDDNADKLLKKIGVNQHYLDIFKKKQVIFDIIKDKTAFVCVDNGDKPREFAMMIQNLKSGSVLIVHDWMSEFYQHDWDIFKDLVEPLYQDKWSEKNAQLAIFKIK